MPTELERWDAIFTIAQLENPDGPSPAPHGLRGRSLTTVARTLARLWGLFRPFLTPYMAVTGIAALDAVALAITSIEAVNPPGPE